MILTLLSNWTVLPRNGGVASLPACVHIDRRTKMFSGTFENTIGLPPEPCVGDAYAYDIVDFVLHRGMLSEETQVCSGCTSVELLTIIAHK